MTWQPLTPSRLHRLAFGSAFGMTDVGLVRTSNEDNFVIDEELGLVMVADGMGGHEAGEVASATALTAIRQYLQQTATQITYARADTTAAQVGAFAHKVDGEADPDATWADETVPAVGTMFDAIEFANRQLYNENVAREMSEGAGMGTTLTGLWRATEAGPLVVFHVGDSRLYRSRGGAFTLLTKDQTLYQQAVDAGMIDDLPKRNMLLQAMGPSPTIKPEIKVHALEPGDLFLLCSDGMYGSVAHAEMADVVATALSAGLEAVCQRLIDIAKTDGGRDNITVLLIAVV